MQHVYGRVHIDCPTLGPCNIMCDSRCLRTILRDLIEIQAAVLKMTLLDVRQQLQYHLRALTELCAR